MLGISKAASQSDIKKAYFQLAKKYHPDTMKNASEKEKDAAKEKFVEIQQAYEILGDEKKRAQFDQFGAAAFDGNGGMGGDGGPGGILIGFVTLALFCHSTFVLRLPMASKC